MQPSWYLARANSTTSPSAWVMNLALPVLAWPITAKLMRRCSLTGGYRADQNGCDILLKVQLPLSTFDAQGMPLAGSQHKTVAKSRHGTIHLLSDFQQLSIPVQPQSRYGSRYLQHLLEALHHPATQAP